MNWGKIIVDQSRELTALRAEYRELADALEANKVFHTPIAKRRKPSKEWDDYENEAIIMTRAALAKARRRLRTHNEPTSSTGV